MKVVINTCFGGYGLSCAAYEELGLECDDYGDAFESERQDPKLVACVEKLGAAASGSFAELKIIEIPDDVEWYIVEYDGKEHVAEVHRTWC
jgi:hypothetical protein